MIKTIVAGVVGFVSLIWILGYHYTIYTKYIGGAQEDARHQIFKKSQAYNDGMVMELMNMRFEYLKSTPEQQAALAGIIRHRVSTYQGEMPYELRIFIDSLPR